MQETKRELPRNFHLVGAMGCDFTHNFPPVLEEGPIKAFLDQALGEGGALGGRREGRGGAGSAAP